MWQVIEGKTAQEEWSMDGRFWLPDSPDRVSAGTLTYTPQLGPVARVVDTPIGDTRPTEEDLARAWTLHGEDLSGIPWSLVGARIAHLKRTSGHRSGNVVELLVDTLVHGVHVGSVDELTVSRASVRVHGLLQLLRGAPGNVGLFPVNVERDTSKELLAECSWGDITLAISAEESFAMDRNAVSLVAHAALRVGTPMAWPEFEAQILDPLSDLVLFAIREPTWIDSVEVVTEQMTLHNDRTVRPLTIVRRPAVHAATEPSGFSVLALNLACVPDPGRIVSRWYELHARVGPVWRLLFATLNVRGLPLENRLVSLMSFAEGYHRALRDGQPLTKAEHDSALKAMLDVLPDDQHRRVYKSPLLYANSPSQRARLKELAEDATSALPVWGLSVSRLVAQAVGTRNWLTHWGERMDVVSGQALANVCFRLELVLHIAILLDLGLEKEVAGNQALAGWVYERLP
jgi:hypothetical protein